MNKCQCNAHYIGLSEEGNTAEIDTAEIDTPRYGPCGEYTNKRYAQGHDAKLKGVLYKLVRSGMEYIYEDGNMLHHTDPTTVLKSNGWPAPVERKAKTRKSGIRKNREVKIGRWVYPVVSSDAGVITYRKKDGTEATTTTGNLV